MPISYILTCILDITSVTEFILLQAKLVSQSLEICPLLHKGQSDIIAGRVFGLHTANLGSVSGTTYGPLGLVGVILRDKP